MSSTSDSAERTTASVGNGIAINPPRLQTIAGRWLMFSDYGAAAQRHMAVVWSCGLAAEFQTHLYLFKLD